MLRYFRSFGRLHARAPVVFIAAGLLVAIILSTGNVYHESKTSIAELWIARGTRVDRELGWIDGLQSTHPHVPVASETTSDIVLTSNNENSSAITKATLLEHMRVLDLFVTSTVTYPVMADGDELPPGSKQSYTNPQTYHYQDWCSNLMPYSMQCLRATIMDCFKQGSRDYPLSIMSQVIGAAGTLDYVIDSMVPGYWGAADSATRAAVYAEALPATQAAIADSVKADLNSATARQIVLEGMADSTVLKNVQAGVGIALKADINGSTASNLLTVVLMQKQGIHHGAALSAVSALTLTEKEVVIDQYTATITPATALDTPGFLNDDAKVAMVDAWASTITVDSALAMPGIMDNIKLGLRGQIKTKVVDNTVSEILANPHWKKDMLKMQHVEVLLQAWITKQVVAELEVEVPKIMPSEMAPNITALVNEDIEDDIQAKVTAAIEPLITDKVLNDENVKNAIGSRMGTGMSQNEATVAVLGDPLIVGSPTAVARAEIRADPSIMDPAIAKATYAVRNDTELMSKAEAIATAIVTGDRVLMHSLVESATAKLKPGATARWTATGSKVDGQAYFSLLTQATAAAEMDIASLTTAQLKRNLTKYVQHTDNPGRGAHTYATLPDLTEENLTDEEIRTKVNENQCFMWDQGAQGLPVVNLGNTAGPRRRFWDKAQANTGGTFTEDITQITALQMAMSTLLPKYMSNRLQGLNDDGMATSPTWTLRSAMTGLQTNQTGSWLAPSEEDAEQIILKYNRMMEKKILTMSAASETEQGIWHGPLLSTSLADALTRQAGADAAAYTSGYFLVLAYAVFQFISWQNLIRSRTLVGFMAFVTVAGGVAGGLGLSAFLGIRINGASSAVLPFVLLGIGVDDAFVMCYNFPLDSEASISETMADFMAEVGPSVTLTSMTNVAIFLIAALIPVPLVTDFSQMAAVTMFVIWIMVLFVFPSVLALDEIRRRAQKLDCFCCLTSTNTKTGYLILPSIVEKILAPFVTGPAGITFSIALLSTILAFAGTSIDKVDLDLQVYDVISSKDKISRAVEERFHSLHAYPWTINARDLDLREPEMQLRFLAAYERVQRTSRYTQTYKMHPFHLMNAWGSPETICNLTDPARTGCSNKYCETSNTNTRGVCGPKVGCNVGFYPAPSCPECGMSDGSIGLVTSRLDENNKSQVYLPLCATKTVLRNTAESIVANVAASLKVDTESAGAVQVLVRSLMATRGIDEATASDALSGLTTAEKEAFVDGFAASIKLPAYATDDNIYCPAYPKEEVKLDPVFGPYHSETNSIHDHFPVSGSKSFEFCWNSFHETNMLSIAYGGKGLFKLNKTVQTARTPLWKADGKLEITRVAMDADFLQSGSDFINIIKEVRAALVADTTLVGVREDKTDGDIFPTGVPFVFWEQYIDLLDHLLRKSVYAGIVCLASVTVLMACMLAETADEGLSELIWSSLHGAVLVVLMCVVTMVEIYGFMGILKIKLNAIPQVTLIMTIGITVEFTAHIMLAFLNAPSPISSPGWTFESRKARALQAMTKMAVPSIHGAISTFLGIVTLAATDTQFIFLYYFTLYSLLVLFGTINGLFVLPALLVLFGPTAIRREVPGIKGNVAKSSVVPFSNANIRK